MLNKLISVNEIQKTCSNFTYSYDIKHLTENYPSKNNPFDHSGENSITFISANKSDSGVQLEDFTIHALGLFMSVNTLFFNNTNRTTESIYASIHKYIKRGETKIEYLIDTDAQNKFEAIISPLKEELKLKYQIRKGYLLEDEWDNVSMACEDEENYVFVNWNTTA